MNTICYHIGFAIGLVGRVVGLFRKPAVREPRIRTVGDFVLCDSDVGSSIYLLLPDRVYADCAHELWSTTTN